ncbi:MAG: hypothetical protein ABI395_01240 [Sphingobium sp.]
MSAALLPRNIFTLGLLAGAGVIGAGLVIWRQLRGTNAPLHAPAAAFAGDGAHPDSFTQTRDAGPDHIRDEDGNDWDALDQASDESFPSSDPPAANNFATPEPIDYSKSGT